MGACLPRIAVEPFPKRHGLRVAMVAPTKVIAGLGASLGIDIIPAPGATGDAHDPPCCILGADECSKMRCHLFSGSCVF